MSLKNKLKRTLATAACLITLLGPTIAIKDKHIEQTAVQEVSKEKSFSFPSIHIKKNTAQARDYNLEGRLTVLGFDVLFNGLKSGIGAKYKGDDFWPAFGKGALSGIIVYGGKEIASYNGTVPFAGAMGKIFHDLGVSMSDNIMRGEDLLSRYRTDFGPVEFDFNKSGLDLYVHPHSAYSLIKSIVKGHRFEIKDTLYNLTPIFSYKEHILRNQGSICGCARQNIIEYSKKGACFILGKKQIISHEMNHVLFFSEYRFLDDLMGKKSDVIKHIPIIRSLAPVFDYLKFGPELAMRLFYAQELINQNTYWYTIPEMEAYTMQRPSKPNFHPFYE
jgi:hypothetical protein